MKHDLVISEAATLHDRVDRVGCNLADSPPGPIALGLMLLQEALIDQLIVRPYAGRWVLRLRASGHALDSRLSRYGERRIELALSQTELANWLGFFLIYHRDGQAPVDHLDLETHWENGAACDFMLEVGKSAPPISSEEARRRLGLPPE